MEIRHPVDGWFGNEFSSNNKHCGVMAAWSLKTLKKSNFLRFLKNDPLRQNFQNPVPKGFIATPIDVLCSNFVKCGWRKSVNRAYGARSKVNPIFGWSIASTRKKTTCPNFTKFSVHCNCNSRTVLLWWQCNMLCTSGFVYDVTA